MQFVDTSKYPLDRLASSAGQAFVERCAQEFAHGGVLVLPGFLTEAAVNAIAQQGQGRIDNAHFCASQHTVFLGNPADLNDHQNATPHTDPMERPLRTSVGSIANDLLDPAGVLQQVYDWPPLTEFIGAVLGHDSFHQSADPLGAVSINVYGQGDLHEWHFDESLFSVTLMIQEAERGGHFEYVTGLRSGDDADVAAIGAVLNGDESQVQRLPFLAGSLSIFGGRNTMHRVTAVEGDRTRLVPVLTYDTVPGSVNSDSVRELFWGRTG